MQNAQKDHQQHELSGVSKCAIQSVRLLDLSIDQNVAITDRLILVHSKAFFR